MGISLLAGCSTPSPTAADIAAQEAEAMAIRMEAEKQRLSAEQKLVEQQLNNIPLWALNPPEHDSEGIYAVGISDSKRADVAIRKASLQAQFELAKAYQQELIVMNAHTFRIMVRLVFLSSIRS
ncbi:hypothetical protein LRP52_48025 [Photobacterium sp. ZSDE20]|uniref:Uncharacterized protein n=1 Tax=Photobacterium pectinilyticum TaxID=2906793 RepID=A0ABT1NDA5_9GAMM|nr:hypothetical protein [Photobacterium sp. ZSDE20]MCQ1061314.1 hypothetical protein [Photobacterium sp. ZSDE20]MDD1829891.1 hypothetical protein [Photobacterium sp. ZSDE20]